MFYGENKTDILGVYIDRLNFNQSVSACCKIIEEGLLGGKCRYIVTPNVDHIVMLKNDTVFQDAYRGASLVLADGNPIVWASKLLGSPLECTVPGSDLVPAIMEKASRLSKPLKVFLLGAGLGVAERAAERIHNQYKNVLIVGCDSPPFGFHINSQENERIVQLVNDSKADLLVIGLGAPKQEIWIHNFHQQVKVPLAICAGAVIDFMAGEKKRAPKWVRRLACEWLHRMLSEPKRLVPRYVRGLCVFPWLVLRDVLRKRC